MLERIFTSFKKTKTNLPVYLGDIHVNSRSRIKSFFEDDQGKESSTDMLASWISDFLEMPFYKESKQAGADAILLDIAIRKYQFGSTVAFHSTPPLPIFWRPSIALDVRLRDAKSHKVLGEFSTQHVMSWSSYLGRIFSLRTLLSLRPAFQSRDIQAQMILALIDCIKWTQTKLPS